MSLRARSGDAWLAAVRSFVGAFFQCADCRKHFLKATSRPEMAHLPAPSDAALWLFRVHNEARVGGGRTGVLTDMGCAFLPLRRCVCWWWSVVNQTPCILLP